ncbi:MAG: hypothetical protein EG828_16435, partial [Deltaproteobacteria bacterium]|nr:hypothetical protein [Deltaproteobacteria bacterium]
MGENTSISSIGMIMDALARAKNGDFTARISTATGDEDNDALADAINALLETLSSGSSESTRTEESMGRFREILESTSDLVSTATPEGRLT